MKHRLAQLVEIKHQTDEEDKVFAAKLDTLAKEHGIELDYTDDYYYEVKEACDPPCPKVTKRTFVCKDVKEITGQRG